MRIPAADTAWPTPIVYRGTELRGAKQFWRGTQRSIAPAETLARIRPHFATAGLTRIANITGLDRIGIPVTIAVRPNSRTLSTSSGKGFSIEAANASGAMEALELFHAEDVRLPTSRAAYRDLPPNRIPAEDLGLVKNHVFNEEWPYTWLTGWDLTSQEDVPIPWAAVHMSADPRRGWELHTFQLTSNGLASGNNFLEALNAGLFEVIERDAVTCHRLAWSRKKAAPPVVDLSTIAHPLVGELLRQCAEADIGVAIFDCTVDTQVPVYMAYVYDRVLNDIGVYRGYGAHLDPEVAMIRAITEAAQGRAIYISGARDDVFRHSYRQLQRHHAVDLAKMIDAMPATVDARLRPSTATPTFEGDTHTAIGHLAALGLRTIVVDLSREEFPISVVKVFVPGLEGYMFDFYEPGRRARQFLDASE
ncbi:MAG TPA: YcaO-like family protein [Acidimicrobiales bacterium]|nr:YcaO-like family protein [Acidimicrobiales bacterium]